MAEFYEAKPGPITPIALVGQRLAIWVAPNWNCFKVIFRESLLRSRPLVFNLGPSAAGAPIPNVPLANLEMSVDPPEIAQLRFYVLDDIEVTLRKGIADTRFKSKNIVSAGDKFTRRVDPCLHTTEFIVLKEEEPNMSAVNPTGYALAQGRVAFFGFRLLLEDLKFSRTTVEEVEKQLGPITFVNAGGM